MTATPAADEATTETSTLVAIDHLTVGRAKLKEAHESLKEGFKKPRSHYFIKSFVEHFLASCLLVRWAACNIRKMEANDAADIVGCIVQMIFAGFMSAYVFIIFGTSDFILWLLRVNLWKVTKVAAKLGFIALFCITAWNWSDTPSVIINSDGDAELWVSQGVGSKIQMSAKTAIKALQVGSDTSKKRDLLPEIRMLSKHLKEANSDKCPNLELLELQVDVAGVSFKELRRSVESAAYNIDILNGVSEQNAQAARARLSQRIDLVDVRHESRSLRNGLSNFFAW